MKNKFTHLIRATLLMAALALTVPGQAAEPAPAAETQKSALALTEDQKAQMKVLKSEEKQALAALKADSSLSKGEVRSKSATLKAEYKAKRNALLSPEQKTARQEHMKKLRDSRVKKAGADTKG
ncbi:MAG: hypothetical protein SFY92_12690 [Verrucomicrobiae bacterium]|nr:hypothetical protein [Verrucomicrobiae bacterium]